MDAKEAVRRVESSQAFRAWQEGNPGFRLVHVFFMTGEVPQVGYYDKDKNVVAAWAAEDVSLGESSEPLASGEQIAELKLDDVKVGFAEARQTAMEALKTDFPKDEPDKEMIILQESNGQMVYNATFFSKSMNTINIKVNAADGSVTAKERFRLFDFCK